MRANLIALALLGAAVGGKVVVDTDADPSTRLRAFRDWFGARGGRWAAGVAPETIESPCGVNGSSRGAYRVVTHARVPMETESGGVSSPPPASCLLTHPSRIRLGDCLGAARVAAAPHF